MILLIHKAKGFAQARYREGVRASISNPTLIGAPLEQLSGAEL